MPFQRENKYGHGRSGIPNKVTAEVKEVIARVFEDGLNGYDGLVAWAKASPEYYTKIWIKLLPMQLNAMPTKTSTIVCKK